MSLKWLAHAALKNGVFSAVGIICESIRAAGYSHISKSSFYISESQGLRERERERERTKKLVESFTRG